MLAVSVEASFAGVGFLGIALCYAANVTPMLNFALRALTEVEAKMTSFERIVEYASLEPEAAKVTPADALLPVPWPMRGDIKFEHCSMRYRRNLELVLKDVSFEVRCSMHAAM